MIQTHLNLSTIHGNTPRLKKVQQKRIDYSCSYRSFSPEYYEGIFSMFDKLGAASENAGDGSSIVERNIEYHTSSFWVKSKWGNNRIFFTLSGMDGMLEGRD